MKKLLSLTLAFCLMVCCMPVQAETFDAEQPVILRQPKDACAPIGEKITFSMEAQGEGLVYTWYYRDPGKKNFAKSAKTGDTYMATMSAEMNGRELYCVATDKNGASVTSESVFMYIGNLKITKDMEDIFALEGEKVVPAVEAQGEGVTYTWYYKDKENKNFIKSSKQTADYATTMTKALDGRQLYCLVSDASGVQLRSYTISLNLIGVRILEQPSDIYAAAGDKIAPAVKAEGNGLSYAWFYKDAGKGKFIKSSKEGPVYTTTMTKELNGRQLYCEITNAAGEKIQSGMITLNLSPIKILQQPQSIHAAEGEKIAPAVMAEGNGLSYLWYYQDVGAAAFVKSAKEGNTYTTTMTQGLDGRRLYCLITDKDGNQAKTNVITLSLAAAAPDASQPAENSSFPVLDATAIPFLGNWYAASLEMAGQTYDPALMGEMYFKFFEDGTAEVKFETPVTVFWYVENQVAYAGTDADDLVTVTIAEDGRLVLDVDSQTTIYFEKETPAAQEPAPSAMPDEAIPGTFPALDMAEAAPFMGNWNAVSVHMGGSAFDPAMFGGIYFNFYEDGTAEMYLEESATILWYAKDGIAYAGPTTDDLLALTINEDGQLVMALEEEMTILFTKENTQAQPPEEDAFDSNTLLEKTYVCSNNGFSLQLVLHGDGTCVLTSANSSITLQWQNSTSLLNGAETACFEIDVDGISLFVFPVADHLEMDYFGTMLNFQPVE